MVDGSLSSLYVRRCPKVSSSGFFPSWYSPVRKGKQWLCSSWNTSDLSPWLQPVMYHVQCDGTPLIPSRVHLWAWVIPKAHKVKYTGSSWHYSLQFHKCAGLTDASCRACSSTSQPLCSDSQLPTGTLMPRGFRLISTPLPLSAWSDLHRPAPSIQWSLQSYIWKGSFPCLTAETARYKEDTCHPLAYCLHLTSRTFLTQ